MLQPSDDEAEVPVGAGLEHVDVVEQEGDVLVVADGLVVIEEGQKGEVKVARLRSGLETVINKP